MDENQLSNIIIGCAIEVHKELGGPGLLEKVYEEALIYELVSKGLKVKRQVQVPIHYKGQKLASPLVIDLLVNDKVIIEVKAQKENNPVFAAQTLTYLRLTNLRLGLVINFGMTLLKRGVERVVNKLPQQGWTNSS